MKTDQSLNILQIIYKPDNLLPLFNCYSKVLMKQGHQITTIFLTGLEDQKTIDATIANQIEFCNFSKKQLRTSKFLVSRKVRHIWQQKHFDLTICHRHKPSFVFSLARLGSKQAPMLSVVHALGQYKRTSRQLHARLLYGASQNKTSIVSVSEAVHTSIEQDFHGKPPCPIASVQNIIDLESVIQNQMNKDAARQYLGVDKNAFVIGNVGRLVADKAQRDLLTAFSTLLKSDHRLANNLQLVIIGTGELEMQLKQYVDSLDISSSVIFTGNIAQASRLMTAFDVFVLPSIIEPFGLVLLEAMAARVPVVATRVGSITSIVDKQARLVSPSSPQQMAEAMLTILTMGYDQRKEIGNAGYNHLTQHFTESKFQKQLNAAINLVMN